MQLKKGQIIDLKIKKLAYGGTGIGDFEGLKVFVNDVMPGDEVEASFTKIKKKFAEAKLIKIVKASKERIEPKCKYAKVCGGCQLQFMPYEKQLEYKKQHIIDCFERIGRLKNSPVEDIIPCEESFYYRNKMEFSFGYDADMKFAIGLHLPGRRYDILDLDTCYLQSEFSTEIVNKVREFAIKKNWLPYKYSNGEGYLRSLFIREGKRTGDLMINLSTAEKVPEDFRKDLEDFVKEMTLLKKENRKITSIYWSQIISKRGTPRQIREHLLYGKATVREEMTLENGDKLSFEILPQSFFQVNTPQAEILYSQVLKMALNKHQKTVFDLFCGTGTIGLFIAKHVESVLGIELNVDAVRSARENAQNNKIFNIDFYTGDVGKLLKTMRERPSLIVVDPPRPGLNQKIIKTLNDFAAEQIIYVSCNPATLARDCQWLAEYGYKVKNIQPVDMFPHTYHIENVVLLER